MHITLLSATVTSFAHAIVTFAVNIHPSLCSRASRLHGAAAALIFDMCTTMAVAPRARADFWHFGGFSRTLSITYFRPVEMGSRVVVECEVVQIGRTLGMCACWRRIGSMRLLRALLTEAGTFSYHPWQDEEGERWGDIVLCGA
jgi:acyl-coenzyme A thioesterase PaaI-like protein